MSALRAVYIAALVVAVAQFIRFRFWRRYPLFVGYTLLGLIITALHPRIDLWPVPSWLRWAPVLIACRIGCCLEILRRQAAGIPRRERIALWIGLIGAPVGIVILGWQIPEGSRIAAVAHELRHMEAGIVAFCLLLPAALWAGKVKRSPADRRHSWLFSLLMLNQLAGLLLWDLQVVTRADWNAVLAASYAVGIVAYALWALSAAPADLPGLLTPHVLAARPQYPDRS